MYIQNLFSEDDLEILKATIESVCFGTLILNSNDKFEANHIPFEFVNDNSDKPVLRAHVSSKSTCCSVGAENSNALVTFVGPNAYISPSWTPGSQTHRKVAPSWNYSAVHVYGKIQFINDEKWITKHIARLTAKLESKREKPWKFKDADPQFIQAMPQYITGLEIAITEIQGKFQASQQYSERTREAIKTGLVNERGELGRQVEQMVTERTPKI